MFTIQENGICILPYHKIQSKIVIYLIIKKIKKTRKAIVLSKELSENKYFKEELIKNQVSILEGKILFPYLLEDCLLYIEKMRHSDIHREEISVTVNELTQSNANILIELAKNVKRINIVTNHIDAFQKLENYLEEKLGISLTITNNRKKSLLKSKIIVNMDFKEEELNKFSINRTALVMNIKDKIEVKSKSFVGIHIYGCQITYNSIFGQDKKFKKFDKNFLYESTIYKKKEYSSIQKQIQEDNVIIVNLIGKNGIIDRKEYLRI